MRSFSPGLFDRLGDDEAAAPAPTTRQQLRSQAIEACRHSITRDLIALLNTRCGMHADTLTPYPAVSGSVVNYGLIDFAGMCMTSDTDQQKICVAVRLAIERHEPRLHKVKVQLRPKTGTINRVDFVITAELKGAQIAGSSGYVIDNRAWVNELKNCVFYLQKIKHKSGVKTYIVFNGNQKLRELISASRYGMQNPKIMKITGGAGGVKQGWTTAKGALSDTLKIAAKEEGKVVLKGSGIALVFVIEMDIAEWHKDYSEIGADGKPKRDLYDLFAKIGTDLIKAALVAALTSATIAIGF